MDRPDVVELFTGVGGLALGLEQAGFSTAIAVELEEIAGRYAQYNLPQTRVLYGDELGDVRKFTKSIYRSLHKRESHPTLVAGGPPCQGFSLAGKKAADDPLNDLVLEFARVVLELRPSIFLMENVPGIKIGNNLQLKTALARLKTAYKTTEPTTLWACDYGVPQARARVFILGARKDLGLTPTFPPATHFSPDGSALTLPGIQVSPTVWEAISDLPDPDQNPELIDGDRAPYEKPPSNPYQEIMRGATQDPDDYGSRVTWDRTICTNIRRTQHGNALMKRFAGLEFGEIDKTSGIRRLHPHEVSTTIRAGTTRDRGAWSAPRPLHPYLNRVVTTRECARIQSFPDWFMFHPSKWHGNRQVGNAVPPLLARALGKHILDILGISRSRASQQPLVRDQALVLRDVVEARESGLSRRRVSQMVIHPRKTPSKA